MRSLGEWNVKVSAISTDDVIQRASYNAVLALKGDAWEVQTLDKLPEGQQPQISVEELLLCEEIIRADERVVKLAAEVGTFNLTSRPPSDTLNTSRRRQA